MSARTGHSFTALVFSGSVLIPSDVTTCPRKRTLLLINEHFFGSSSSVLLWLLEVARKPVATDTCVHRFGPDNDIVQVHQTVFIGQSFQQGSLVSGKLLVHLSVQKAYKSTCTDLCV